VTLNSTQITGIKHGFSFRALLKYLAARRILIDIMRAFALIVHVSAQLFQLFFAYSMRSITLNSDLYPARLGPSPVIKEASLQ